jgi:hypothetical protein
VRPRGIAGRTRRQLASGLISELAATGQEDQGRPHIAGLLARAIAVAAAQIHLAAEHDVVIPQFLGRAEFLEQLKDLAHKAGADFIEIVLLDSRENALRRFCRTRLSSQRSSSTGSRDG